MTESAFEKTECSKGCIPMFLARRLHELSQDLDCLSKFGLSDRQVNQLANQAMLSFWMSIEDTGGFRELMIRFYEHRHKLRTQETSFGTEIKTKWISGNLDAHKIFEKIQVIHMKETTQLCF